MSKSNNKLLVAVALIIAAVAVAFYLKSEAPSQKASLSPLSNLALDQLVEIKAVKGDESSTLVKTEGGSWAIPERDNFPLDEEKLRKLVYSLIDITTVDRMTDAPDKYEKMGLGDAPSGGSIELTGPSDSSLGSLLIGDRRQGGRGQYVRFGDDPAVYMVSSGITLNANPKHWIDSTLLEIGKEKVESVSVTHENPDDSLVLNRPEGENSFELDGGKEELDESKVNSLVNALSRLTIEDVYKEDDPSAKEADFSITALFTTDMKQELSLEIAETVGGCFLRLSAKADGEAEDEVTRVSGLAKGRLFKVSKYACDKLRVKRSELIKN